MVYVITHIVSAYTTPHHSNLNEVNCMSSSTKDSKDTTVTKAPKRKGRPPKAALKKPKGIIGRPKGDAAIINEFKARMLASPKSVKVLEAVFDAALDNEHKSQSAAWKLLLDRIAPTAAFEADVIKGGGKSSIQINITGVGAAAVSDSKDDITDADYEVV